MENIIAECTYNGRIFRLTHTVEKVTACSSINPKVDIVRLYIHAKDKFNNMYWREFDCLSIGDGNEIKYQALLGAILNLAEKNQNTKDPTITQINDACLSYDHSFGLKTETERKQMQCEAQEWKRAWDKTNNKCICMVEEKQPVPHCPVHGEDSDFKKNVTLREETAKYFVSLCDSAIEEYNLHKFISTDTLEKLKNTLKALTSWSTGGRESEK